MKNLFILELLKFIYFFFVNIVKLKKCNVYKILILKKLIIKNLRNEGFIFLIFKLNDFSKISFDGFVVFG